MGSAAHGVHGQCREDEGQARADEQAHQHHGIHQGEILKGDGGTHLLDLLNIRGHEGQGGEGGGADGEALAGGGGGVAQGIQGVGAGTYLRLQAGHFGDTAGVISHGAVGVGGQGDAQGREHTHGGQGDAVQTHARAGRTTGQEEGQQNTDGHDDDGNGCGQHTQAQAADDDGGGAGLTLAAQLLGGLIGIGGIVFGSLADEHAGHQAGENSNIQAPMLNAQQRPDQEKGDDGDEDGGQVGAPGQGLEQSTLVGIFIGLDEEGADDGAENTHGCHDHGNGHGLEGLTGEGGYAQGGGGDDGAYIGLIQVCTHTGYVSHVVAHVIGDDGRVAGVILGDARFHLAHKVRAHIGGLGENAAAYTSKQGHGAGAHAEGQHGTGDVRRLQLEDKAQQQEPHGDVQQAQTYHGEAHNAAGGERHTQALIQPIAAGIGGAAVGLCGNAHAHKAAEAGEKAAGQECKGYEPGQQLAPCHDAQHHDHAGKENAHHGILPA